MTFFFLCSTVILQASVQGCKTSVNPLALSDHSDSRKRTRTSLPASGIGGRSVAGFDTLTFVDSIIAQMYHTGEQDKDNLIKVDIRCLEMRSVVSK